MRYLISFIIIVFIIGSLIYFKPCGADKFKIVDCPYVEAGFNPYPHDYQIVNYDVRGFCCNYDIKEEDRFLEKIDSIIINYCKTIDKRKYDYVMFVFYNGCEWDCEMVKYNLTIEMTDCNDSEIVYASVHFNNIDTNKVKFGSYKLKSHPVKTNVNGSPIPNIFYRTLEIE